MSNLFCAASCRLYLILSIIALSAVFTSCNKLEKTSVGGDLIPGIDKLITDTLLLNVETSQTLADSANLDTTAIRRNEAVCIGYINDDIFGTTSGAAYFQVLPLAYPFKYPVAKDSLFLDSVVLAMNYTGTYGDTALATQVDVYRITDPSFVNTRAYKIYEAPEYNSANKLGTASFTPLQLKKGYKLTYKNDTTFNQLRIRLNDQLGRELLDENNTTGALQNDSSFKQFLNGFAVIPDTLGSGKGALHYFGLNATSTSLQLYYRVKKPDGSTDTTFSVFPFATASAKTAIANKIYRNIPAGLNNSNGEFAYLMTAPGIASYIKLKGLDTLKGKPYIIHRAELIAEQADDNSVSTIFTPPATHLYSLNAFGEQVPIPYDSVFYYNRASFDFIRNVTLYAISQEYAGGSPSYKSINSKLLVTYRYNLTRYVQNLINGNAQPRSFKLSAPYFAEFSGGNSSIVPFNALAAGRVKLYGGAHSARPMRLKIYYSKP
jgi:hypothetical protein